MKRPNAEELFEYVSIPQELSVWKRARIALFIRFDPQCRQQVEKMQSTWASYFKPEPDVMDSVMRVYSKLRSDETLILKGWKLCDARPVIKPKREFSVFQVLAASGVAASVGAVVLWTGPAGNSGLAVANFEEPSGLQSVQRISNPIQLKRQDPPMARVRIQDRNTIQVHYMQPELLQSIEFETTGGQ
jgi:hypothetical protein